MPPGVEMQKELTSLLSSSVWEDAQAPVGKFFKEDTMIPISCTETPPQESSKTPIHSLTPTDSPEFSQNLYLTMIYLSGPHIHLYPRSSPEYTPNPSPNFRTILIWVELKNTRSRGGSKEIQPRAALANMSYLEYQTDYTANTMTQVF